MTRRFFLRNGFLFVAIALLGLRSLPAQEPAGIVHTVDFPKGDAAWKVTFPDREKAPLPNGEAKPQSSPPAIPRITEVSIVRLGGIRRDTATWADGSTTNMWWPQGSMLLVHQSKPGGPPKVMKSGQASDFRLDASSFAWVNKSTFQGYEEIQKTKCRYYQSRMVSPDGEERVFKAWIDDKTLRPLALEAGRGFCVFSFDQPLPPGPLVMPGDFQKALAYIEAFFAPAKK